MDLDKVVLGMEEVIKDKPYAIVIQNYDGENKVNVFSRINGKDVPASDVSDYSVEAFRDAYKKTVNSIIYLRSDGVELLTKCPNGFAVHAIYDTQTGGFFEVGIKCGTRLCYTTLITDDLIKVSNTSELRNIVIHTSMLTGNGLSYKEGFIPEPKYNKRNMLKEVVAWLTLKQ